MLHNLTGDPITIVVVTGEYTAPSTSKKTVSGTGFPGIAEAMKGLAKATSAMMASETNAM
ncbi:MAG: hypothetical protein BHV61_03915 [Collinsella sp. 60_9]|nr:MAG: hypothetical protein BHV61_03915 [Collinsella sp. 60_9]